MTHPPHVTKRERVVLEIIARGHPARTMNFENARGDGSTNALEWSEAQIAAGLEHDDFGECIAHLTAGKLIDSGRQLPGFFARLGGADVKYFFWINEHGRRFLEQNPAESLPETPPLPSRADLKATDVDDAGVSSRIASIPDPT